MLSATVLAASDYLAPLANGAALPVLDERMRSVCRKSFRRVDRFVQLALVGSGNCAAQARLGPGCGIYLGSANGPLISNIRVQQHMLRQHELARPFDFVNTLGSIAGFHIADNLQLEGPNLFVSRRARSLEAALEIALTDLAMGVVEQALVGVIEECPLPVADQRRRLPVADDTVLAEGSHWLLLGSAPQTRQLSITLQRFDNAGALTRYLDMHLTKATAIGLGRSATPALGQLLDQRGARIVNVTESGLAFHDSIESAWLIGKLAVDGPRDLMLVHGNLEGDGCLLHCRAQVPVD